MMIGSGAWVAALPRSRNNKEKSQQSQIAGFPWASRGEWNRVMIKLQIICGVASFAGGTDVRTSAFIPNPHFVFFSGRDVSRL